MPINFPTTGLTNGQEFSPLGIPGAKYIYNAAKGAWIGTGGKGDKGDPGPPGSGGSYTLPVATASVLGGVKQGTNITIAADGTISASGGSGGSYTLPVATASVLGGVKQGTNITIAADGTISASGGGGGSSYTLPVATASVLGGVKQGTNITIAADGTISASGGGGSVTTSAVGTAIAGMTKGGVGTYILISRARTPGDSMNEVGGLPGTWQEMGNATVINYCCGGSSSFQYGGLWLRTL